MADSLPKLDFTASGIESRHDRSTRAGPCQAGEKPDGRGLPRAVRTQKAEHRSCRNLEVEPVQCSDIAVALDETVTGDRGFQFPSSASDRPTGTRWVRLFRLARSQAPRSACCRRQPAARA